MSAIIVMLFGLIFLFPFNSAGEDKNPLELQEAKLTIPIRQKHGEYVEDSLRKLLGEKGWQKLQKIHFSFDQILYSEATRALHKQSTPDEIINCANEMLAMRRMGCRDKFTHLITAQEVTHEENSTESYGGIGVVLRDEDGSVVIDRIIPNGPAFNSNLERDDTVLKVNGKDALNFLHAGNLITGKVGTNLVLLVEHYNRKREQIILMRQKIFAPIVSQSFLPGNPRISVIHHTSFSLEAPAEFHSALETAREKRVQRVIIDLRNNPGGFIFSAIKCLSYFMSHGDIVVTKFQDGHSYSYGYQSRWDKEEGGDYRYMRIVILVNRYTASASEIFAGTMQSWGYPVVGERTFGKGVGQTPVDLEDKSVLELTNFEFFVGNDRIEVQGKGIIPDYRVIQEESPPVDHQLVRAIQLLTR